MDRAKAKRRRGAVCFLVLSAGIVAAAVISGGNLGPDPGFSATATVAAAIFLLFGFLAENDDELDTLADALKALGAGVAVPLAVLTSNAALPIAGRIVILVLAIVLAVIFFSRKETPPAPSS